MLFFGIMTKCCWLCDSGHGSQSLLIIITMVMCLVDLEGKFKGIGNLLIIPDSSMFDGDRILKSDVLGWKTHI